MILPKNDISMMMVRNVLRTPSLDLGTLCSSPNVNRYSRYRPGYWSVYNQELTFNPPLGGNVNDPRGTDPNTGLSTQVYKLGDFRGYNSNAEAPYVFGAADETIYIPADHSSTKVSSTVNFNLGEVDWWGDEWLTNYFHGRNDIPTHYEYVYAFNPTTLATYGKSHRSNLEVSGYNSRMIFNVSVNTPGQGATTVVNLQFGLGTDAKMQVKFPDVFKTLRFFRANKPIWTLVVPSFGDAMSNLKAALIGLSDDDDVSTSKVRYCDFYPYSGDAIIGSNTLSVKQSGATIVMYPSNNRYDVAQLRWQVKARIVCFTNNNIANVVWEHTQTVVMALSGSGFTYNFPIPQIVRDGYNYMIYLEDFGTTKVERI